MLEYMMHLNRPKKLQKTNKLEDKLTVTQFFAAIKKDDEELIYVRRLRSKTIGKAGLILVELKNDSLRNPQLIIAKVLRSITEYQSIYISPDITPKPRGNKILHLDKKEAK